MFADPQVRHQQMKITIEHPQHGPMDVLGFPIKFTDDPCRIHRPPPDLGADTDAILGEMGYDAAAIADMLISGSMSALTPDLTPQMKREVAVFLSGKPLPASGDLPEVTLK